MKSTKENIESLSKKAHMLAGLRNYEILEEEPLEDHVNISAKDARGMKILFQCIPSGETIGVKRIRVLRNKMEEEGIGKAVVVGGGKYSYVAKLTAEEAGIELIPSDFPSFNIFVHELVPKHEILSKEDAEALLKKLRVAPYQLPHIKYDDPAARSIGARPGDILKITRKESTAGEHIYYRYVI